MENQNNSPDAPAERPSPTKDFLKGVFYTILYYASGLGLAALSYAIVGHPYIHAPGLHHIVLFLTFAGGFIFTLLLTVKYILETRTWKLRGILLTNMVAILSFILVIYNSLHEEKDSAAERGDEISISENGDTTIMYHNKNIIYMKVKDSVLLNFIDSARFQKIVDSKGIRYRAEDFQ